MQKVIFLLAIMFTVFSCNKEVPTQFSEEALNDSFISLEGQSVFFSKILDKYQGQTLFIDVWASWCGDCLKGMPKVKALQQEYSDVTFIFLSLDKSQKAWKKGINKYNVVGEHYFMQSGWKGSFGEFLDLDWIPRYMIIDKQGTINLFRAERADDKRIKEHL
ncbi:MAG: TlpA family protein disulfide reductase [Flaviramulus sp.]|nr:TlpA disulfide reductase family protein [Flaviramulus sp.]NNC51308.1 TlpA family protein disulfide reductase [Flaviramulus sp.]